MGFQSLALPNSLPVGAGLRYDVGLLYIVGAEGVQCLYEGQA